MCSVDVLTADIFDITGFAGTDNNYQISQNPYYNYYDDQNHSTNIYII